MKRTIRPWNVSFTVEGLNAERFLRSAAQQGIRLTGIRRSGVRKLTALAPESEIPVLQELAARGGWRLVQGRRTGAGCAAEWVHSRWLLCAAVVLAAAVLFAASRIVWQIDVIDAGTYAADIRMALDEWGIAAPMLRSRVDIGNLQEALAWRYPRIAWFECGWRGSTLLIRVVEGVLPRTSQQESGTKDIVAARDCIIHSVVTSAGTPVVEAGDIVRAGDVLIKGEERTEAGAVRPVAARGTVTGRVWEGTSVTMSVLETETEYTGNTETVWTLRTPWFDLWKVKASAFEQYDVSVSETLICGMFLPVKLHVETRLEGKIVRRLREQEQVKAEAAEAARRKLYEKIAPEESLIDIWGNCSMIDDENVLSVAIGEMLVEIGIPRSSTGMAAPGE